MPERTLAGKTLFISGASRGIGKAIALRAARDGANVVIAAKTARPHSALPGTIYSAAEEIEAAGGRALPCLCNVRFEAQVQAAVDKAVETFGGIDILVNNASAIDLAQTLDVSMRRYDLMHNVNARGTFLCTKTCLPHLSRAENPHVLMLSPPLNMNPEWFAKHLAYTISKYGMSMCVLGFAGELGGAGIGVNALWPRTAIATAAVRNLLGGEQAILRCRTPDIVADAAHAILTRDARQCTGNFFIDDDVLREEGVSDFERYRVAPGDAELMKDFFLD